MAAILTTAFRGVTLALLVVLGAAVLDLELRVDALHHAQHRAQAPRDELKMVDIGHVDALRLLDRDPAQLEAVLGLEPSDELTSAPGCLCPALAARLRASEPGDFLELDVTRGGRPIRVVVLLH